MSFCGWGPPSSGGTFTGGALTTDLTLPDNVAIVFGTGSDTDISFNATDLIWNQVAGGIVFQMNGTETFRQDSSGDISLKTATSLLIGDTTIFDLHVNATDTIMNQASGDLLIRIAGSNNLVIRDDESVRIPTELTIGADAAPATSSILHISSTTKGSILSPMTAAQMLAITTTGEGLLVFVTDAQVQAYFNFNDTISKWASMGYDVVVNKSGSTLAVSDVVIQDTATTTGVLLSSGTSTNKTVVGVVVVGGANNADVIIKYVGRVHVNKIAGAFAINDFVVTSTTAGKAMSQATGSGGTFGMIIEATSGTTVEILMIPIERF